MDDNYAKFAVDTAQQVVNEETDKLYGEIVEDIAVMLKHWAERLSDRIDVRMKALGIAQELLIAVSWEPKDMPVFDFTGITNTGVQDEQQ